MKNQRLAALSSCRERDKFPAPVVMFHDGKENWLADGFHRYHGARKADLAELMCDVQAAGTVAGAGGRTRRADAIGGDLVSHAVRRRDDRYDSAKRGETRDQANRGEVEMKSGWWAVALTVVVAGSAWAYVVHRLFTGAGTDDAGATLGAAILAPPALAFCLASLLARRRPALRVVLLVVTALACGFGALGMTGDPVDPFTILGVYMIQWGGGLAHVWC